MKIESLDHKSESAYEWAVIPEDLPKSNLFFITAKTASPSIHPEDKEDPIRQFSLPELHDAGRSLGRRFINMNHNQRVNIETAFTVDAQYNSTTEAVEGLIYVPDQVRDMINSGKIKKVSVEYVWREIRKTESGGSEFIGIIFDKISLLEESWLQQYGFNAGDSLSEIRKAEAITTAIGEKRGFLNGKMESADIAVINSDKELVPLPKAGEGPDGKLVFNKVSKEEIKEIPPEQGMKQDMITEGLKDPKQGFYNAEKCKECGKLSECSKNSYKECSVSLVVDGFTETAATLITAANEMQKPEGTNVMPIAPDGPVLNQTPVSNAQPDTNVASAGMVVDESGAAYFGKVEGDNPHKNLDMPKAPSNVEPVNQLIKEEKGKMVQSSQNPASDENKSDAKKEGTALSDCTPIATSNEINVIGMDESKQKVESAEEPKKEEKKPDPVKEPEPIKTPEAPKAPEVTVAVPIQSTPTPTEDYKAKFESVSVELKTTKEHEAFLEGANKKLSENSKLSDDKIATETKAAYIKGKQEVIAKFKEVIPDDSQFGYNIQNSTRSLIYNLKKKCLEVSGE